MVSEAVEADTFLRIYEAIEVNLTNSPPRLNLLHYFAIFQDSSRKIQIPVRHLCPIQKVVWSSFDYMTGPELGFTWEAVIPASESSSSCKSSFSSSSRDDSSLTSSMTKGGGSAADYEEIDDVYKVSCLDACKLSALILKYHVNFFFLKK